MPVDSICAADPANTSQCCFAHGYKTHAHAHSDQAVPCYGYQTSRKPQDLPGQTSQAGKVTCPGKPRHLVTVASAEHPDKALPVPAELGCNVKLSLESLEGLM